MTFIIENTTDNITIDKRTISRTAAGSKRAVTMENEISPVLPVIREIISGNEKFQNKATVKSHGESKYLEVTFHTDIVSPDGKGIYLVQVEVMHKNGSYQLAVSAPTLSEGIIQTVIGRNGTKMYSFDLVDAPRFSAKKMAACFAEEIQGIVDEDTVSYHFVKRIISDISE